jgi:small subunit ribosomal protein S16
MTTLRNLKIRQKIIRFRKRGQKHYPFYEIISTYKDKKRNGSFLEKLGYFNPNVYEHAFVINTYRLSFLLNKNTVISKTVKKYLVKFLVL